MYKLDIVIHVNNQMLDPKSHTDQNLHCSQPYNIKKKQLTLVAEHQ